ncbi:TPA: NAD-dependent dehydratase [Candidatus Falkowbacteria bacterium]|jgi:UDP-glucuronate decarboxylase|nr:MAG: NAD-dependent epimerase/dehydratase family protein [Candidatus Falkowbacteria bacterium GW2011_GWF2_43_32]HBA36757.1 NAD-dependent dehydratase [Candidatus Falkowbacteria bacterium]
MSKQVIFDKKNVLVAGGAGFIGSHLCDELVKTDKVICVDNFVTGSERNIDHLLANPNFVFINHDLSQPLDLEAQAGLKKFKIEFQGLQEIYNLACPMSPRNFLENRLATLLANSYAVKNLLDLAVKYNSKLLQFSSSVVYGPRQSEARGKQAKESDLGFVDQLSERSAYDEGKRFAETMVSNYRAIHNIDARIIRLFRIYGPRLEANDDQMIPDYITAALDNKDITIAGDTDFSSSFCYISDALDAIFKFMNSDLAGPINIGSDVDVNLTDLVKIIIKETGSQSSITYADGKLFFSELVLPDIRLAKNELGWMPVVTLENGLKKTIFDIEAHKRLQGLGG